MGVSIVRCTLPAAKLPGWGVLREGQVYPLTLSTDHHREVMDAYYKDRAGFDAAISPVGVAAEAVRYLAPLSRDIQLLCQGLNYASHRAEGGLKEDSHNDENLIFYKASSSISAPNETILRPAGCELLDYEIELGLVMREDVPAGARVSEDNLADYLGGLILCNDVSSRDMMFGAPILQWFKGKSQRTFCPVGPVLYLLDAGELSQLYRMRLLLKVNGEVKQDAITDQLIHRPPKTLTELAEFTDLKKGDLLLTGTPGGVILNMTLKTGLAVMLNLTNEKKRRRKFVAAQLAKFRYLQPGDVLELEIKSIDGSIDLGRQRNEITEA
jgi:2-keto-4-pentenoate hydratase/2-oxohepta-3-ene-1,7-dioic acid hydratase in catechol pathway